MFDPASVFQDFVNAAEVIKYFPFVHLTDAYISTLCEKLKDVFLNETSVLFIEAPIVICGDTHGQFAETFRIFQIHGFPPKTKYLFLGDYVDRGPQSVDNIVFLLTLKFLYPKEIFLIRGNHESEEISTVYGLRDECIRRLSFTIYSNLIELFECIPFAAIVSETIFCVHGGIPPKVVKIQELLEFKRPLDISENEIVSDLLWADPNGEIEGYAKSPRGVSIIFGKDVCQEFLKENKLSLIVRSHEFCQSGINFPFGKNGGLVTIFSAANYCSSMNSGAVLTVNEDLILHFTITQCKASDNKPQ